MRFPCINCFHEIIEKYEGTNYGYIYTVVKGHIIISGRAIKKSGYSCLGGQAATFTQTFL